MSKAQGAVSSEPQRYWLEQIEACEASGNTIAEYAAEHGLAAQAIHGGKKLLIKKGVSARTHPVRFHRAQVVGAVFGSEWGVHV